MMSRKIGWKEIEEMAGADEWDGYSWFTLALLVLIIILACTLHHYFGELL